MARTTDAPTAVNPPIALLAEITYRCPLQCVYCSNPLVMTGKDAELSSEQWFDVLDQAASLGVLQVHFSGGEPLLRPDILDLIEHASELELFSNLITSGLGFTETMAHALKAAELGSFQLSIQGSDPEMVQKVANGPFWKRKMEAAERVKRAGLSLSMNAVLHRMNLHQAGAIIELAASLGAERLELANSQYYGWALLNREHLLPSHDQLLAVEEEVREKRERYGDRMEILWVVPDYYEDFPKNCMGGWGDSLLSVAPDGRVLPCLAASVLPDLDLPRITERSLRWIWYDSPAFNAFRGTDWMQEPCRSCPMRTEDHGGCRCQAYLLTNDATATDPVCIYAPDHDTVVRAKQEAAARGTAGPVYRTLDGPRSADESVAS